jgi:hypothetical protein
VAGVASSSLVPIFVANSSIEIYNFRTSDSPKFVVCTTCRALDRAIATSALIQPGPHLHAAVNRPRIICPGPDFVSIRATLHDAVVYFVANVLGAKARGERHSGRRYRNQQAANDDAGVKVFHSPLPGPLASQGESVRPTRKPIILARSSVCPRRRLADRTSSAMPAQEPPRRRCLLQSPPVIHADPSVGGP